MSDDFNAETEELVETACATCGGPITVRMPKECGIMRETLVRWSAIVSHDACLQQLRLKQRQADMMAQAEERMQRWTTLCPPEFRKVLDWKNPNISRPHYEKVMAWTYGVKGLLLHGQSGRCKTRLTYKLLEREFVAGRKVLAITHVEFRQMATQAAMDSEYGLIKFMRLMKKPEILFIDDLGKGHITPVSEEALSEVIDYRNRYNLPILYTTNDALDKLHRRLSEERGEPIMRRIVDNTTPIDF